MASRPDLPLPSDRTLAAPCIACGYNGAGYWQSGTHAKDCPWFDVGGMEARQKIVRESAQLYVKALTAYYRSLNRKRKGAPPHG